MHLVIQNSAIPKAYQLYILIWEFPDIPTWHVCDSDLEFTQINV